MSQAISVLKTAQIDGNMVRITQQLSPTLYKEVAALLKKYGAKWSRKEQANIIPEHFLPAFQNDFAAGDFSTRKKSIAQETGFFPTPQELASRMPLFCDQFLGCRMLEPSAGHGAILQAGFAAGAGSAVAVEKSPENYRIIQSKFDRTDHEIQTINDDFLNLGIADLGLFDAVLMNPPFSGKQDMAHVLHAAQFLANGGTLVAIVSAGMCTNTDSKTVEVRNLVHSTGGMIEELPDNSFAESGTKVRTCLITVHAHK